ncbi:hypothetical protein BH10ACI4_BH10ACI4_09560 [soil metagenome]
MFNTFKKLLTKQQPQSVNLRRRWVETADERCPLACVWFALPDVTAENEEATAELPPRPKPAFSLVGEGRRFALYSSLSCNLYPIASAIAL